MKPNKLTWRRSSRCSTGACVETATTAAAVHVRDSKNPGQAPLTFRHAEWSAFLEAVRAGDFDR